ncbi:hypothetical protein ACQP2F_43445 [Actinoplanes sp. CA-030573]|uniref:hypothetical protein n=1 Tax=Actinoplanes sp. CA-030573 TaxID=3239898 RepID=UPI003D901E16
MRELLSAAEVAEIAAHPVVLGESTELDAIDLISAWASHVRKIDTDRALPWEDHSVGNEHDLAAALHIRDFVEQALTALPGPLRQRLADWVAGVDERFSSFTADDPDGKMARIADVDLSGRAWWWRRVPVDGPIVRDLANY